MALLLGLLKPIQLINGFILALGRGISTVALAVMVIVILLQIVMRYFFNNALPWPEEAARFLMLWLVGLMAPMAYRQGGFVAIDMLERALPKSLAALLSLVLIVIPLGVLIVAAGLGYDEITGFGAKFKSPTLYYPTLEGWEKLPKKYMMASLFVCVCLLILVNIELLIRAIINLLGGGGRLDPLADAEMAGAD